MHKAPYVFPICGGRKIDHLKGNIEALRLELSSEDVEEIDNALPFDAGFPLAFLLGEGDEKHNTHFTASDGTFLSMNAHIDSVEDVKVI